MYMPTDCTEHVRTLITAPNVVVVIVIIIVIIIYYYLRQGVLRSVVLVGRLVRRCMCVCSCVR